MSNPLETIEFDTNLTSNEALDVMGECLDIVLDHLKLYPVQKRIFFDRMMNEFTRKKRELW